MYELIKITENTYYLKSRNNVGLLKYDNDVYLIDSGNDTESGKKILRIINENGWILKGIINTHSNADHTGGNNYLQSKTNCKVVSTEIENTISKFPILEPSFLYGGLPYKELKNKFLMSKPTLETSSLESVKGHFEYISLPGHYLDMIGIKTSDNVCFIADSVFSEDTINKYHIFFIYDVNKYLETLDYLDTLEVNLFIPSHANATNDIKHLTKLNRNKINEICNTITELLKERKTFEELLKNIMDEFDLILNDSQYVLVGSTLKSFLTHLKERGIIDRLFENNYMYWKTN